MQNLLFLKAVFVHIDKIVTPIGLHSIDIFMDDAAILDVYAPSMPGRTPGNMVNAICRRYWTQLRDNWYAASGLLAPGLTSGLRT